MCFKLNHRKEQLGNHSCIEQMTKHPVIADLSVPVPILSELTGD